jgi:hypothetical protein
LGVAGSEFLCLLTPGVARPQFFAVAGLVFPSAGLRPVSSLPDSSFSPARELSARAATGFHFALCSGSEVFMGFTLDFLDSLFSVSAQLQSLVSSKFFSPRSDFSDSFFSVLAQLQLLVGSKFFSPRLDLVSVLIPGRFSHGHIYVKSFCFKRLWIFAGLINSSSCGQGSWSIQRAADRQGSGRSSCSQSPLSDCLLARLFIRPGNKFLFTAALICVPIFWSYRLSSVSASGPPCSVSRAIDLAVLSCPLS